MTTFRFLGKIFLLFFALSCLITVVFAHSGRTDSDGGHHDRSDGSYHYHHGYSAHGHYDMDGDGADDCPYQFKTNKTSEPKSSENSFNLKNIDIYDIGIIIGCLIMGFYGGGVIICILDDLFLNGLQYEKPILHAIIIGIVFVIFFAIFFFLSFTSGFFNS
jgi:hypothetical protein